MTNQDRATTETEMPDLSTERQRDGNARRPGDALDQDQTNPNVGSDFVASGTRRPRGQF